MPNIGPRTESQPAAIGWGIIGASAIVHDRMADALRLRTSSPGPSERDQKTQAGKQPLSTIMAIYSPNTLRARMFADTLHIPHAYSQLDQLLEHRDIQCIYVANHPRDHARTIMAALDAGKHVFFEMPLALDVSTAEDLIFKAELHGLTLGMNAPWRADPVLQHLRQLVLDDELGVLIGGRVTNTGLLPLAKQGWRLLPNGGGVHFDRTQRDLDLIVFLTGQNVSEVYADSRIKILGDHSKLDVPEDLVATIALAGSGAGSGTTFQLHDSFLIPHVPCSVELYGSIGNAIATNWCDADKPTSIQLLQHGDPQAIHIGSDMLRIRVIEEFLLAMLTGRKPLATGHDGLTALRATLAIQSAIAKHRPTPLPIHATSGHTNI